MQKLLFWGIIILFSVPLLAQPEVDSTRRFQLEHVKNKERAILANVGSFQRLNSYINPLAASGIAAGVTITGDQFKSWGVQSSEYQQNIYISLADANQMMGMSLSYSKYWHWRVYTRADKRLFIYAGMGANLDINPEMSLLSGGNNDISFKGGIQTLPSGLLKYRFNTRKQRFEFTQQISFPLFGFSVLPRYGYYVYTGITNDNMDIGSLFTSLHNNLGMSARSYIDWRRQKNGKELNSFIRIGYIYDAYRINYETRHQKGCHMFVIGAVRKF